MCLTRMYGCMYIRPSVLTTYHSSKSGQPFKSYGTIDRLTDALVELITSLFASGQGLKEELLLQNITLSFALR